MQLPTFETERYYAQYEFTCPHLLSVSDCESMSIGGLLELAGVSHEALLDQQLGYTESAGRASLRSAIANRYDTVKAEHVLLLNSPIEGLYLLSQLFTGPTIVLLPAYDALKNLPKNLLGWKLIPTETGWELDWESLDRLGERNVELLVVNFPHNPTGFQPTPQDWKRLLAWAKERGVWLFCDEMYRGLGPRLPSAVDLYEKSVILNGLSKPQGLPGLRAGWLVSRNPELLDKLLGLRLYTSICTAAPVVFLAEVALKVEPEILKRNTDIVAKNVQLASQFFASHSAFHWRPPVAGSVALVELPKGYEAEEYCHTLAEIYGVVLLPSSFLGVEDRYVRFGFGRRGFSEALQAYDRVLKSQLDVSVADEIVCDPAFLTDRSDSASVILERSLKNFSRRKFMSKFTLHTLETAPSESKPLLEKSKKAFGMIPNLHAVMAEAPALLEGYQKLHELAQSTSFTTEELTVVWQAINVEHECHYCVPAHTAIAYGQKVDKEVVEALRDETPLPKEKLEALRTFTLLVARNRGVVNEEQTKEFFEAGFEGRHILEIIVILAQKVMSNYTNHVAETPVDKPFAKYEWSRKTPVNA